MPGEIAEMMLNGDMCQVCGEWIDGGDGPGFPLTCDGCGVAWIERPELPHQSARSPKTKKWGCSACNQQFSSREASTDHIFDKHEGPKPVRLKGAKK